MHALTLFLPATIELGLAAILIMSVVGVTLGMLAALRPGGVIESVVRVVSVVGAGLPVFWLGLIMQILFFKELHLLPLAGAALADAVTTFAHHGHVRAGLAVDGELGGFVVIASVSRASCGHTGLWWGRDRGPDDAHLYP